MKNNNMKKYTSFGEFLFDSPRNVISIIVIWAMSFAGMAVAYKDRYDFDPYVFGGVIFFLSFIMILSILRVLLIYKKNS